MQLFIQNKKIISPKLTKIKCRFEILFCELKSHFMNVHASTLRAVVARKINKIKINERRYVGGFRIEMVLSTIQIG